MNYAISNRKWYYLGIGIIGLVFLFLPLSILEGVNQYLFSYNEFIYTVIFASLIYMLILVPFNAIYHRFYSENYFDSVLKTIAIILPVLVVIALLMMIFGHSGQVESTFTPYFYLLIVYLVIIHGFNLHVTFKETM